ncbi:MAG: S8 family serine peptidase [Burkholderiales bacterium]|jgi:hypothetical protein|nr:S8 family serine peptidase [Burkholderiales bacterium]
MKRFLLAVAIGLSIVSSAYAQEEIAFDAQQTPDAFAKKAYIIFLNDDATNGYDSSPIRALSNDGLEEKQKPEMRRLAKDLGDYYGFRHVSITSWIGNTISAYLDDAQVSGLKKDPKVKSVIEDVLIPLFPKQYLETSEVLPRLEPKATPRWDDQGVTSWGTIAMGGSRMASSNSVPIYLVDYGVGYHKDLANNITNRLAPNEPDDPPYPYTYKVGCYAHATGVAGVMGASSNSAHGLYEKVPTVSISVLPDYNQNKHCLDGDAYSSHTFKGLDEAYLEILRSEKMGIVNFSMNFPTVNGRPSPQKPELDAWIKKLATPIGTYKGAFVVQSAANYNRDACDNAYSSPNANDGIMVVGAFDKYGARAINMQGSSQYGSNYGNCVDIWAPGKDIYMPWNNTGVRDYEQYGNIEHNGHIRDDGTSYAAPYIAAAASYLATTYNLTTPQAVEQKIRSLMYNVGDDGFGNMMRSIDLSSIPSAPAPQVTWKINGKAVSGTVYMTTSDKFTFEYSSANANNCDVKGETSPNGSSFSPWYYASNVGASYNWGGALQQMAEGWYQWTAICTGSGGTTSQPLKMRVTFGPCSADDTAPLYVSRYTGSYHNSYMSTDISLHYSALSQGYVNAGTVAKLTKTKRHPTSSQPFKQFFNGSFINHWYGWTSGDISYVLSNGWRFERDEGYIYDQPLTGTLKLYVAWKNWNGVWDVEHRYTTSMYELDDWVRKEGFIFKEIMGYVCP